MNNKKRIIIKLALVLNLTITVGVESARGFVNAPQAVSFHSEPHYSAVPQISFISHSAPSTQKLLEDDAIYFNLAQRDPVYLALIDTDPDYLRYHVMPCRNVTSLTIIETKYSRITDEDLAFLPQWNSVERIFLFGCSRLTERIFSVLQQCPSLREVSIIGNECISRTKLAEFQRYLRIRAATDRR